MLVLIGFVFRYGGLWRAACGLWLLPPVAETVSLEAEFGKVLV